MVANSCLGQREWQAKTILPPLILVWHSFLFAASGRALPGWHAFDTKRRRHDANRHAYAALAAKACHPGTQACHPAAFSAVPPRCYKDRLEIAIQ